LTIVLIAGCAPAATSTTAELEKKIADLGADKAALEAKIAELEAPPEVYNWKLQQLGTATQNYLVDPFCADVKAISDGQINISIYSGGELVPTVELVDAVATGVVDIGIGCGYYWSDSIPEAGVEAGLPFSWKKLEDVDIIFYQMGLLDIMREAYAERGVYYLGPILADPYCIIAKKECHSLDDFRGLKLRSTGLVAKALALMGMNPTYIPIEECYLGIATGAIDGLLYGGAKGYLDGSFNEQAKFYYASPVINPVVTNMFINLKLWNSLPKDLQSTIEVAAREASRYYGDSFAVEEYNARRLMFKNTGCVTITLPDEVVAEMTALAMPVWDEVAAKSPRAAKAVQIVKDYVKMVGYVK